MKKIKTIIFDLGGVLINFNRQACVDSFQALGYKDADNLIDPYKQSGTFLKLEEGLIQPEEFYAEISRGAGHPVDGQLVDQALYNFVTDIPAYKLDLLLELRRKGYRVFMLSNTNVIMFERMSAVNFTTQGLSVNDYFDQLFLSYKMHLAKPDAAIFEKMIAESGIRPSESLFIDDSPANIATASALGFDTYLAAEQEDYRPIFDNYQVLE